MWVTTHCFRYYWALDGRMRWLANDALQRSHPCNKQYTGFCEIVFFFNEQFCVLMISLFISCDVPLIECSIWSRRVVTLSFPELSAGWLSKVKTYDRRFENEIKYVRVDIIQLLFMFFAIIDRVKPFFLFRWTQSVTSWNSSQSRLTS